MQEIQKVIDLIDSAIKEDADHLITGWNIIADGYDEEVDKYRQTITSSNEWLAVYQADLIEKTGITTLKIKFTWALSIKFRLLTSKRISLGELM